MKKKIVLRKCIVTRLQLPKNELLRIVKNKDGLIFIDLSGKANGRGAYLQKKIEVINLAKKRDALARVFECKVEESLYQELIDHCEH